MRPSGQRRPGLDIVRNCRVSFDGSALVVSGRDGRPRRHAVGPSGIVRAVLVDAREVTVGGRMGRPLAAGWGELLLLDTAEAVVLRLRIDDWVPESNRLAALPADRQRLLARSGATALLKKAGVPVAMATGDAPAGGERFRLPNALPSWFAAVRGVAFAAWFVTWCAGLIADAPWLLVLSALAALTGPTAHLAVRVTDGLRERGLRPTGVRIAPSPAQDAGATVRFTATAAVIVTNQELVLVDGIGYERRLARSGAQGVTRLVRFTDSATREPVCVELRGPDGQVRAALPWKWWFAGPEGEHRWQQLKSTMGMEADDRALRGQSWPDDPVTRADGSLMGQLPIARVRKLSRFPVSTLGGANSWMMLLQALLSMSAGIGATAEPNHQAAVVVLSLLAALGVTLPLCMHELRSRTRWERPVQGQGDVA